MAEEFDKDYWEQRYRGQATVRTRRPNPQLVTEVGNLTPGRALDAGCGEGAEAIWLAARGWTVTATDIATTALRLARENAREEGGDVAGRIDWVAADLTEWVPAEEQFDLVCTHYVHPSGSWQTLLARLAAAVVPRGTLLVVGHHPSGPQHAAAADAYLTAEGLAAELAPELWDIDVAEARSRSVTGHEGREATLRDTVLKARKRS